MDLTWLSPNTATRRTIECSIGRFKGGQKLAFPWQVGSNHVIDIDVPIGYTISWEVIESNSESVLHNSRNVVTSGTGPKAIFTLGSFTSHTNYSGLVDADQCVIGYDFRVTMTNGISTFYRRFRRMLEMTPKTPLESDATQVINLDTMSGDGFFNYSGAGDKKAQIIFIKGTRQFSGNGHAVDSIKPIGFGSLVSSDPAYPVHVFLQPGLIIQPRSGFALQAIKVAEGCQNVFINGGSDFENPVKLEWADNIGTGEYLVYMQLFNSGTTLAQGVRGITFMGFNINGYSTNASFGGGGVTINYPGSQGVNTYANWIADGLQAFSRFKLYNLSIMNTVDEMFYPGHFQDTDGFPGLNKSVFHHINGSHIGNETLQLGMCYNSEAHDCFTTDGAYKNNSGHNHGFQINGANNTAFYHNTILGCFQTANLQNGQFGNNTFVFGNVFENKSAGSFINMNIRLEQQAGASTHYQCVQNTIICPDGTNNNTFLINKLSGSVTTEFNRLDLANNLSVSSKATRYSTLNSPSMTNVYGLGLHGGGDIAFYLATSITTPLFVDHAKSNYHFSSLSSPAFTTRAVITNGHPLMNEDREGVELVIDVHGAYSGYELMT